jgi:propionyl-CoA carboxylase beta chain
MHGQRNCCYGAKEPRRLSLKTEINKAEDPAAKLLEKETEYASCCLLIPILQPRGFVDEMI